MFFANLEKTIFYQLFCGNNNLRLQQMLLKFSTFLFLLLSLPLMANILCKNNKH